MNHKIPQIGSETKESIRNWIRNVSIKSKIQASTQLLETGYNSKKISLEVIYPSK